MATKISEPTLTIDGKKYRISHLSQEARAHLERLKFAEKEVRRLSMMANMARAAVQTHRQALIDAVTRQYDLKRYDH